MRPRPPTLPTFLAALLPALGLSAPARALDVDGTKFPDRQKLGNAELVANGGGLRSRVFLKVYAMALYLPEKQADAEAAVAAAGPKRIAIVTLRDLTAAQFSDALRSGIDKNHDNDVVAALAERMNRFAADLATIGEAPKGTRIDIDWLPESGTRLSVGGQAVGQDIAGEDFYRALLRIWLGRKPAQDDLRDALLGKVR